MLSLFCGRRLLWGRCCRSFDVGNCSGSFVGNCADDFFAGVEIVEVVESRSIVSSVTDIETS